MSKPKKAKNTDKAQFWKFRFFWMNKETKLLELTLISKTNKKKTLTEFKKFLKAKIELHEPDMVAVDSKGYK